MRIGMVAHALGTQGGIESVAWHLSRWMLKKGHTVTAIAAQAPEPLPKGMTLEKISLPRLPFALRQLAFARESAKAVERLRPGLDAVVSHVNTFASVDLMACHSVHPVGTAKVLALDPNPLRRAWYRLKTLSPLMNWLSGVNYRDPGLKVALATSSGIGRELLGLYPGLQGKLVTVGNGFDPAQRKPARPAERARLRKKLGLKPSDTALLFIGKEFHRKGLESIVRALALLPEKVKLWVIGNNVDTVPTAHYTGLVKELGLEGRVNFLGHQKDLLGFYQAADAFVFPTLYEAFAMVSIESLACGLPLLACRANGTEDLIEPGRNGAFIERGGESIAAAVKKYILPAARRRALSRGALRTAKAYTWEKIAGRYLEALR